MKHIPVLLSVLACALSFTACARVPSSASAATSAAATPSETAHRPAAVPVTVAPQALPTAIVHKSPTCGCCEGWVEHLRHAGFQVEVRNADNLNPVKERLGVPLGKGSCHTAEIGGYVVEGHVPVQDIRRLLAERPDARGLVLPGMPLGSPGMEVPDGTVQPYTVELVRRDGSVEAFASH